MPVFRVVLQCSSATNHADGLFRTIVGVTDAESRDGKHVRIACERARLLGYGGPHRVTQTYALDSMTAPQSPSLDERAPAPAVILPPTSSQARLVAIVDDARQVEPRGGSGKGRRAGRCSARRGA